MAYNSMEEIDDTVSSVIEFGIGAVLKIVFSVIVAGALFTLVGSTPDALVAALLLGCLYVGSFIGAAILK